MQEINTCNRREIGAVLNIYKSLINMYLLSQMGIGKKFGITVPLISLLITSVPATFFYEIVCIPLGDAA